jgi:nitroreductase
METVTSENIIQLLNWRYATKSFDTNKKLNDEQLATLLNAIQLAPSSYGLQPYQIIVVSNQEVKEALKGAAYGQPQLAQASHVMVFARTKNYTTAHVDEYASNIIATRGVTAEEIKGFVDTMKGTVESQTQDELAVWNSKQAYLALGILLESAALNGIDACPMEGFESAKFDEILGLDAKNLASVVIATIGFRSTEDDFQHFKKVRKSQEDLFIHI